MRLRDLAVFVDDVRNAAGVLVARALGGAVGDADAALGVAEQRKGELVLLGELGVGGDVVEAGAEDLRVLRLVLVDQVPEPGTLGGSAGCVGLRVEPEDDLAAAVVAQPRGAAGVVLHFEIGGGIARLEHGSSSLDEVTKLTGQRHGRIVVA